MIKQPAETGMRAVVHVHFRKVKYVTLWIVWLLYSWFAVTVYICLFYLHLSFSS